MSSQQPLVSVIIPVYNRENLIGDCINSAIGQTYSNIEVIVVDNASTDGTWSICKEFAAKDRRVSVFRNDQNIGPVRNWLACLAQVRGEYLKILWSDDLIHPEFLVKTLPYFEDAQVGFVYSSVELFEKVISDKKHKLYDGIGTSVVESSRFIEGALLGDENFPCSPGCAIFRTSDVRNNLKEQIPNRVGSDFSSHAIGSDLLLYLITAKQYPKFAVVSEPLSFFRAHLGSITTSAPFGKIPLHYDLVKGYFAESYAIEPRLLEKLNAVNLIHLIRFGGKKYGIHSLDDFFPTLTGSRIDASYFIYRVWRHYFFRISKLFGRTQRWVQF